MIIFPAIILGLLIIVFVLVWRKAYILEKTGEISHADIEEDSVQKRRWLVFPSKKREPEAEIVKETEPSMAKAEELFHKKQYISAEKWYLEAVKADPKNPRIYARLGSIYLEQKNFSDARDAFEEATKLDDTVASRFFNLSYIYNSIGDINLAQANAKKATRMDPRNSKYKRWMDELKKGRL